MSITVIVSHDRVTDAVTIFLRGDPAGGVVESHLCGEQLWGGSVIVDVDDSGVPTSVEMLGASKIVAGGRFDREMVRLERDSDASTTTLWLVSTPLLQSGEGIVDEMCETYADAVLLMTVDAKVLGMTFRGRAADVW